MDMTIKIKQIEALKQEIKEKEKQEIELSREIRQKRKELERLNQSDLPILMFVLDETIPIPVYPEDYCFEYVYYYPDFDRIQCKYKHTSNEVLSNAIDARPLFKPVGMPERFWPGRVHDKKNELEEAIHIIQTELSNIFDNAEIESWPQLATALNERISRCRK